jgi:hypothetical protein
MSACRFVWRALSSSRGLRRFGPQLVDRGLGVGATFARKRDQCGHSGADVGERELDCDETRLKTRQGNAVGKLELGMVPAVTRSAASACPKLFRSGPRILGVTRFQAGRRGTENPSLEHNRCCLNVARASRPLRQRQGSRLARSRAWDAFDLKRVTRDVGRVPQWERGSLDHRARTGDSLIRAVHPLLYFN